MIRKILKNEEFLRILEKLYFVVRKVNYGTRIGDSISKRVGRSQEFIDYKNYQPGDDLRSIDWNLYGRLEKLYLKLFHEEVDLNIYIFIDSSFSMSGEEYRENKLTYATKLAAAISYIGLKSLNSVGLISFSEGIDKILPPSRKQSHIYHIFDFLDNVQLSKGTNINGTMRQFVLRKDAAAGVALIISDFFSTPGYKDGIKYLIHKGLMVNLIHVLSPNDISPNIIGKTRIQDTESYNALNININEIVLKRYHEKLKTFIDDLNSFCTAYNVPYLHTSTEISFEETILKFFMIQNM